MRSKQNILVFVLLGLLATAVYGAYLTGREPASPTASRSRLAASDSAIDVDQSSLMAAEQLARLPTTVDEGPLAQDALRLGGQEMDLAFAQAIRDEVHRSHATTPEMTAIGARLQSARQQLAVDQSDVSRLAAKLKESSTTNAVQGESGLGDRLEIVRARLALDSDEVDDASGDLMRVGGDPEGRLRAMTAEHDAASRSSDSARVVVAPPVELHGMIHAAEGWLALHRKITLLLRARAAAESSATVFAKRHNQLDSAGDAARQTAANGAGATLSHEAAAALLITTRRRALDSKAKAGLDQRVDDQRRLADLYGRWTDVVRALQRGELSRALRGLAIILAILLVALLVDQWIEHLLVRLSMDQRSIQTLCIVTRVSLQVLGVLLALLVIFGPPANLGTFLGLAGAGLTVALKDFIIGFFGWFVLMGRNGIRIGDLVEINGVTGEVVELGMFHTMLLETGSWTESGHPTGRRVRFTNSFAIEGHYINFSASGQWLWDEVQIVVPQGRDPYPIVAAMQQRVEAATADTAKPAELEWKGGRRSQVASPPTAAPTVSVKPVLGGFEISLRYIVQAAARSPLRAELYRAAVAILGEAEGGAAGKKVEATG